LDCYCIILSVPLCPEGNRFLAGEIHLVPWRWSGIEKHACVTEGSAGNDLTASFVFVLKACDGEYESIDAMVPFR